MAHSDYPENETSTSQWWTNQAAQADAEIAAARDFAATPQGRYQALERKARAMRADRSAHSDAEIAAVEAELDAVYAAIKAESDAKFAAEWTLERTKARRAEWNARVKGGEFGRTKINLKLIMAAQEAQGWTTDSLKRAIDLYGL